MRGEHTTQVRIHIIQIKVNHLRRRIAVEHLAALEGEGASASPCIPRACGLELINRHVISIRPDPQLGVIVHLENRNHEIISVPAPQRIGGLGNCDTLMELGGDKVQRKLTHQPPIGLVVIEHHRIAVVVGLTQRPHTLPKHIPWQRPQNPGPGMLIVDSPNQIDHLQVIIESHIAFHIRRGHPKAEHRCIVQVAQPTKRTRGAQRRR